MESGKKVYGLFLEAQTRTPQRAVYHHVRLGKPFLEIDKSLPSGCPGPMELFEEIDRMKLGYREHSYGFERLEDAVASAEKVLKINEDPNLRLFVPDEDVYRIEVKEMHVHPESNGVFVVRTIATVDYAWGTIPTNQPVSKTNLNRHSKVRARWKQTLQEFNYANN